MLKKVTSESIDQIKILKSKVEAAEVVARKWESQIGYCEEIVKKKIRQTIPIYLSQQTLGHLRLISNQISHH